MCVGSSEELDLVLKVMTGGRGEEHNNSLVPSRAVTLAKTNFTIVDLYKREHKMRSQY